MSLQELAMRDLDLIKQEEQECATGAASRLTLTRGDEIVRPQDFMRSPGRGGGRYYALLQRKLRVRERAAPLSNQSKCGKAGAEETNLVLDRPICVPHK